MAKNEQSILEGLNFGGFSAEPKKQQPKEEKKPKQEKKPAIKKSAPERKPAVSEISAEDREDVPQITESAYAAARRVKQKKVNRAVRTTINLTPYIHDRLTLATERGEIKSANDLINYLLEDYFKN